MRYVLSYDPNGGEGEVPADREVIAHGVFDLPMEPHPTRDKAVFIGWTEKPYDVFTEDPGDLVKIQITMPVGDKVMYAAWGEDLGGNGVNGSDGIPDWLQTRHTLTYDLNGGKGDLPADNGKKIVEGAVWTLATEPVPTRDKAVFLGWSLEKHGVWTSKPSDSIFVTEITMGDKDVTVYAVWAIDSNNDGIPDYEQNLGGKPKTGDDNTIGLWLALMTASMLGMAVCLTATRKRSKRED